MRSVIDVSCLWRFHDTSACLLTLGETGAEPRSVLKTLFRFSINGVELWVCQSSFEALREIYEVPLRPLHQNLATERDPDLFRCFVSVGCQLTPAYGISVGIKLTWRTFLLLRNTFWRSNVLLKSRTISVSRDQKKEGKENYRMWRFWTGIFSSWIW